MRHLPSHATSHRRWASSSENMLAMSEIRHGHFNLSISISDQARYWYLSLLRYCTIPISEQSYFWYQTFLWNISMSMTMSLSMSMSILHENCRGYRFGHGEGNRHGYGQSHGRGHEYSCLAHHKFSKLTGLKSHPILFMLLDQTTKSISISRGSDSPFNIKPAWRIWYRTRGKQRNTRRYFLKIRRRCSATYSFIPLSLL